MNWYNAETADYWAGELARMCLPIEGVKGLDLFGSIGRGQWTRMSDLDIIITVENNLYTEWLRLCRQSVAHDFYSDHRYERLHAAANVLGANWLRQGWVNVLDIFLFPSNWRERLQELQLTLPHADPQFMANIAMDAVPYDEEQQCFPKSLERRAAYHDERIFADGYAQQMLD